MTEAPPSPTARQPVPNVRVRARNSRHVLDSAREFVARHGVEELSMRRLADEAEVSVRTLYNLFGDKQGLIAALVQESFDAMDAAAEAVEATDPTDPIERIWEAVAVSVAATTRHVPKAVVAAIVADPGLYRRLSRGWHGRQTVAESIEAATRSGALRADLAPDLLVQHAGTVFLHLLGRWAAGEIDERVLRAGVLHAFDVCLLAIARPHVRARLAEHAAGLEAHRTRLLELDAEGR
ncbi:TetR/AcrR family transcriptional regulator [Yinghuangia sp. ASG 101]|uniref:TetR/AcrR family transcriptional regulator n=1 Tax=Yinghuangia sp. ASG 101 TaxID=2896848 RepID=UPI001E2F3535|nr:TetR/AcrR family transcriptional regulator [Yinghuangia sp. ASG 101]UGQ12822.1 TetR/AcrR family transcriptional regulator [Yinghuangia sp. ASG 101]